MRRDGPSVSTRTGRLEAQQGAVDPRDVAGLAARCAAAEAGTTPALVLAGAERRLGGWLGTLESRGGTDRPPFLVLLEDAKAPGATGSPGRW